MSSIITTRQALIAISLFASSANSLSTANIVRRRANHFRYDSPAGCDYYCQSSALTSCAPNGTLKYSCVCSLGGLQAVANCGSCTWQAPQGHLFVNETEVNFGGWMSSWLDSCYDEGYVIADTDYSTIVAQATRASAASVAASTSSYVASTAASDSPTSAPTAATQQYQLTGVLSDLDSRDFESGVCNFFYFSLINPEYEICIGSGSVVFPSTGCSGTDCTLTSTTPKLGWGLGGDLTLPSRLKCDGSVHTVAEGLLIPDAMRAGKGSDPYYACTCGGPISSVPPFCQGVCGPACETGLEVPSRALTCNVAYRCFGGPTYNLREINNDTCTVPKLVGTSSGNVNYILDKDGLISCSGTSESVGDCPGSNPENTSGSRTCTCSGPAAGVDTCNNVQNSTDTQSTNGNGVSSTNSNGNTQTAPNGALRLSALRAFIGIAISTLICAVIST